ncbi:MAG: hypothetical protein ACR2JP_00725 [Acidimicrobiia bacterium]
MTVLKKGQHVEELTRKVGQRPRAGVVVTVHDETVEVRWDDGHTSILSGGMLRPAPAKPS